MTDRELIDYLKTFTGYSVGPSAQDVADDFKISASTARRRLAALLEEGRVTRIDNGRGSFHDYRWRALG